MSDSQQIINACAFGLTGAGKSFLLNLLCGLQLSISKRQVEFQQEQIFKTVQGQSKTKQYKSYTLLDKQLVLVDTPGSRDTNNEDRIKNYLQFIKYFSTKQQQNKIILLISESDIDASRGQDIKNYLMQDLFNKFKDISLLQNSILVVFTKGRPLDLNDESYKDSLKEKRDQLIDLFQSSENQDLKIQDGNQNFFSSIPLENYKTLSKPSDEKEIQILYQEIEEINKALISQNIKPINDIQIRTESELDDELKDFIFQKFNNIFRQFLIKNIVENTEIPYEEKIQTLKKEVENLKNFENYKTKINEIKQQGTFPENDVLELEEIFQLIQDYNFVSCQKIQHCKYCIIDLIQQYKPQKQGNTLIIRRFFMHSSTVEKLIQQEGQRVDKVIVLANHAFIVDQNKFTFKGGQLVIKCQKFIISQNAKFIDLSGQDAVQFQNRADVGQNGLPGRPGQNGGNFLLLVQEIIPKQQLINQQNEGLSIYVMGGFQNEHKRLESQNNMTNNLEKIVQKDQQLLKSKSNQQKLIIDVTGGRGGDGQNGGNGRHGLNGQDGDLQGIMQRNENLMFDNINVTSIQKNLLTFNSEYQLFYRSDGQIGQNGGNSGCGGKLGLQGYPGDCQILLFDGKNIDTQTLKTYCLNGRNGESGTPGNRGLGGRQAFGVFQEEYFCPFLRGITSRLEQQNLNRDLTRISNIAAYSAVIGADIITTVRSSSAILTRTVGLPVTLTISAVQTIGSVISANKNNRFIDGPRFTDIRAQNGQNGNRPYSLNEQNYQKPQEKLNLKKNQYCYSLQEVCSIFCQDNPNCTQKNIS
ncbi:hypothetical protein ABPG74_001352 [Tetrahymena malaccensis]